jgi:hypothetical protein
MFKKGMTKMGGRKAGTPNTFTKSFREALLIAYENIGGNEAFSRWAAENQTEFYRIAARLIPTELKTHSEPVRVIIDTLGTYTDPPTEIAPRLLIKSEPQE